MIYLIIGTGFVLFAPVYSDEGYYIWAARNVWQGKLLYVDFVYHQFPLLPFLYAPFSDLGFSTYYILKFLSLFSTLGLIILIYKHVLKTTSDYSSAYMAAALLIFNGMFIDWNTVVKMYAHANFLCYLSFYLIMLFKLDRSSKNKSLLFIIGLVSGIAANMRLVYFGGTAALLLYLCYVSYKNSLSKKDFLNYMAFFMLGVLLASSVTIYFFVLYKEYFLFGVFKHNFYAQQGVWAEETNGLRWLKFFLMPQNLLLFFFATLSLNKKFKYKVLSILFLLSLFVTNATGYYINEYLTSLLPYIIFIVGVNYKMLQDKFVVRNFSFMRYVITIYSICFFIAVPYFRNYLQGRTLEPNLLQLKKIVDYEKSLKGHKVFSSWYIYTLFSDKKNTIINNDYVYCCMIGKPTLYEIDKYNLPTKEKLYTLIEKRYFDVIVLNENTPYALLENKDRIADYYKLDKVFGNTKFFVKD